MYKIWSIITVDVRGILRFKQMEGLLEGHRFSFKSAKSQEAKSTNDESQRRRICQCVICLGAQFDGERGRACLCSNLLVKMASELQYLH